MKDMLTNKLKAMAAALVVLGTLGFGTGRLARVASAEGPAAKDQADEVLKAAQSGAITPEHAQVLLQQAQVDLNLAQRRVRQAELVYAEAQRHASRRAENSGQGAAAAAIAARFKYCVPVETGRTTTNDGGRIEILEVWGTRPRIEIGGNYLVRGKYTMPKREKGNLYFSQTATASPGIGPMMDTQITETQKGQGEFTLMHEMREPGYFHLILTGPQYSDKFADVYFGTGDNVWREK